MVHMGQAIDTFRRYTATEYLAIDDASDVRHEYLSGHIVPLDWAGLRHARITANFARHLRAGLGGEQRVVRTLGQRVGGMGPQAFLYPDVTVADGTPAFTSSHGSGSLANPRLIAEVLSPATQVRDWGEKFIQYRRIGALQEYLLVATDRPHVAHFHRAADGGWVIDDEVAGLPAAFRLRSFDVELRLADIYDRVTFPPLPPEPEQPE